MDGGLLRVGEVLVVDPARFTPRYDRLLVAALRRQGIPVTLLWAPEVHGACPADENSRSEVAYARSLGQTPWRQISRRAGWLRRGLRGLQYPLDQAGLVDRAREASRALVHLQWSLVPWLDIWVVKALRRHAPVVLTAHNVLPHEERPWDPPAYRRLYASVDAVVVHSHAARQRLDPLCPGARVTVLPMPAGGWQTADVGPSSNETTPNASARARLGLPATGPIVLFFGLRRGYKGLPVLLEAWTRLGPRVPSAHLVVAGPGGPVDAHADVTTAVSRPGPVQAQSDVTMRTHGHRTPPGDPVAARVRDRPGYISERDVDDYFRAADVVALPYLRTDDSAVLAMALSAGRPVVVSDVGGLPETAGDAGIVVPPGDSGALAAALEQVLTSTEVRRRLQAAAALRAAARSWDDFAQGHLELYDRARRHWAAAGP